MWQEQKYDSSLNRHKPDRQKSSLAWLCPTGQALRHHTTLNGKRQANPLMGGLEGGSGCCPSGQGVQKIRGEWNTGRGMSSQSIARGLECCGAAPAPSLLYLGSLHSRASYSITNICHVRVLLSSHLPPAWEDVEGRVAGVGGGSSCCSVLMARQRQKKKKNNPSFNTRS